MKLAENYYSIACHNPPKFIVAHRELNQIVSMSVSEEEYSEYEEGKVIWVEEGIPERKPDLIC